MDQKQLTNLLDRASQAYYCNGELLMSDTDFDLKLKELQKMETESGIVYPNSPTQRVGSDLQDGFGKYTHPADNPMYTIENVYTHEDLIKWIGKMHVNYNIDAFVMEPKYDGISVELEYTDGVLTHATTRGDKLIGDDITANVRTIKSVPLSFNTLPNSNITKVCVRGEIMMPKSVLAELNANGATFANTRNACSGSIKQLDPKVTAERKLIFRPWDVFYYYEDDERIEPFKYHSDKFQNLKDNKFITELDSVVFSASDYDIEAVIANYHNAIKNLDYDCDGIVIKVNEIQAENSIGTSDHRALEWAIARKWNDEKEVITILEDVEFMTGRTGNITPVGKLTPVACDGVVISNVQLHNEKFIKDLGLMIGSPVKIVRSGSVIPYCTGTATWDEYMNTLGANPVKKYPIRDIKFPTVCPKCGTPLVKSGEIWKCPNDQCSAKIARRIEHWVSKGCMNIMDIGENVIDDLIESGLVVDSPMDLYDMISEQSADDVVSILGEGYGRKSVKKMFDEIRLSKKRPLESIIMGLSIDGIGKQNAKLLAKEFGSFEKLLYAKVEDLIAVPSVGYVLANNIVNFMHDYGEEWFDFLTREGFNVNYQEEQNKAIQEEQTLSGMTICFTGSSQYWNDDDVEDVFTSYGAKCVHGVPKKLDVLVIGAKPGPKKVQTATELGKTIMTEDEFIDKYKIAVPSLTEQAKAEEVKSVEESESNENSLW
jgi:DNA ligase (NAD+)